MILQFACKIFKFLKFMGAFIALREIYHTHIFAKLKYFAKEILYSFCEIISFRFIHNVPSF